MNNPALYSKHHSISTFNAKIILDEYIGSMKWNSYDSVLDIGCGTGEVTTEQLAPSLPQDFKKLVGLDINPDMVKLAKSKNQNPKIDFVVCDAMCKDISNYIDEQFDHIFSFYCLHWIQDQRQAVKNMYDLLKPGGDVLLTFVESSQLYNLFESMASKPKWSSYLENTKMFISPYHNCADSETVFTKLLVEQGFVVKECRVVESPGNCLDLSDLKNTMIAINPFLNQIPENLRNDYIKDYQKEMFNFSFTKMLNNKELVYNLPHYLFIVLAVKP